MTQPFTVAVVQRPPVLLDQSVHLDATLDVAGHYGRPDVFRLTIDRSPHEPVTFGEVS